MRGKNNSAEDVDKFENERQVANGYSHYKPRRSVCYGGLKFMRLLRRATAEFDKRSRDCNVGGARV